jgi:hypothetical protein
MDGSCATDHLMRANFLVIYDPGKRRRLCTADSLVNWPKWTSVRALWPTRPKLEMVLVPAHGFVTYLVKVYFLNRLSPTSTFQSVPEAILVMEGPGEISINFCQHDLQGSITSFRMVIGIKTS